METLAIDPPEYQPRQPGELQVATPLPDTPPIPVAVALAFIGHCNTVMGKRLVSVDSDYGPLTEVVDEELHPHQELAFKAACRLIHNYLCQEDGDGKPFTAE